MFQFNLYLFQGLVGSCYLCFFSQVSRLVFAGKAMLNGTIMHGKSTTLKMKSTAIVQ